MRDRCAITLTGGDTLESGAGIANARGAPGTLGFLGVRRDDGRAVLVTSHHVAFGGGAVAGNPVSLVGGRSGARHTTRVGTSSYGREDVVHVDAGDVWLDAAVVDLDASIVEGAAMQVARFDPADTRLAVGDRVTKIGAGSGMTEGVVVDIAFDDRIVVARRPRLAPRQILVRSVARGRAFTAPGDSGAALRNERGEIVGLLWGMTPSGDGVACPIAPVLQVLHVHVAEVVAVRETATARGM